MNAAVAHDLSDSAADFTRVVWPVIKEHCGGGTFVPVESASTSGFDSNLDIQAGIDAWQVHQELGIRGIASRVQWGDKAWNTFTVRKSRASGVKTEYEKRLAAITGSGGWLYPHLTVQAYVSKRGGTGRLLSVGVIETAELFTYLENAPERVNKDGQSSFAYYEWQWIVAKNPATGLWTITTSEDDDPWAW